jgi:photosystem II stability/assembly factor-like uncharacterized protein
MKKLIFLLVFYCSLFVTHYSLSQWVQMSNGMGTNRNVWVLASSENSVYACTDSTIFRSTNYGQNWFAVSDNPNFSYITDLVVNDNNLFAGAWNGVYSSTNYGANWTYKGLTGNVHSLMFNGVYLFACSNNATTSKLYNSINSGNNWNICNFPNLIINSFAISSYIFACTNSGGIFRSSNSGLTWSPVNSGLPSVNCIALIAQDAMLFVSVSSYGIYRSTNYGENWYAVNNGLGSNIIYSFAAYGNYLLAGGVGIYFSSNNGNSWFKKSYDNLDNVPIGSLLIANNYVYAGTGNQSVWRRSLSEIIGINKISETVPTSYSLNQNYPNPFNPSTNIKYQISKNSFAKLIVYDALSREVETLVNEKQSSGTYEVTFDGGNLASGIYFYKLETENFSDVKRMVLVK